MGEPTAHGVIAMFLANLSTLVKLAVICFLIGFGCGIVVAERAHPPDEVRTVTLAPDG